MINLWINALVSIALSILAISSNCNHTYHVMSDELRHYQIINEEWVCGPIDNYTTTGRWQRIDIDTNETRWQDCMLKHNIKYCGPEPDPINISNLD